jgi:hypothetical protein
MLLDGNKEEIRMDKLPFRNKTTDYATMGKKGNMIYWDAIDAVSEEYVRQIIEFSTKELKIPEFMTEDDVLLEAGKMVTEHLVNYLENICSAEFPYIDENY